MERKENDRSAKLSTILCPAQLPRYHSAGSTVGPATEPPNHCTCQGSISHLAGPQLPKSECSYMFEAFKAVYRSFLKKVSRDH